MADFVETSNTKTAVRELAAAIADVTTFSSIVEGVIATNPWGCTAYTSGDVPQAPVTKTREAYTAYVMYEDDDANNVGQIAARAETVAGFSTCITELLADAELTAAMGGDPYRDFEAERYSASLRCHDPNGEIYTVTFGRDQVRISSYSDDAICAVIEAWADTVPALA